MSLREQLADGLTALKNSAGWILRHAKSDPVLTAASAAPFLRLCGIVLGGFYLIRMAVLAQHDLEMKTGDSDFLLGKIASAQFFATHMLPQATALGVAVREGATVTAKMLETQF